jgi:tetratricopeptide (TPR) repeat protein
MEDVVQLGILYVKEGNYQEGFRLLKDAMEKFNGKNPEEIPPRLQSYYGLCLGVLYRDTKEGLEHCRAAMKREFFQPDLYLNLGKLYLLAGQKASAVQILYKGLKLDDGHKGILSELKKLGIREIPVIRFLPRGHFLNRILGQLRYRVKS